MGISNAFNVARSGLNTTSHWAELVSRNIANASNESYGRQSLSVTSSNGGTVMPTGVQRAADEALNTLYREELGMLSRQDAIADGLTVYGATLGDADSPTSPANRLAEMHSGFTLLFNAPSDLAAQYAALQSAQSMVQGLNDLSDSLDATVTETERAIGTDVSDANRVLSDLAALNHSLSRTEPGTESMAGLQDRQASLLTELAELMDFRIEPRASGAIDIQTSLGYRLVEDRTAYEITYTPGSGTLMADGLDISPPNGIREGRLAGGIELVTEVVPHLRGQLDDFARGLMVTFEEADTSLGLGEAGLFTDSGNRYGVLDPTGLAGRIAVNTAVLPEAGGALHRLRDGIGADTPGPSAASGQIGAFLDGLEGKQTFDGSTGLPPKASLGDAAVTMVASQHGIRAQALTGRDNLAASTASLDAARLNAQGVNIDDELQKLLTIERSYSANSKVIGTLTEMLDTLLSIVR